MGTLLIKLLVRPLGYAVVSLGLLNCAPEPKYRTPDLGETINISPAVINEQLGPKEIDSRAIQLNVMWGGRAIDANKGNPTLHFYDHAGELKFSRSWAELEESYRRTGCTESMVSTLDGYLMGSALICDSSFSLTGITSIKATDARGESREATSWGVHRINDQVTAVSIGLY